MNVNLWTIPLALGLAMFWGGCSDDDPFADEPSFSGPVATREALVWVDELRQELVFAQPGDQSLEVRRVPVGIDRTKIAWTAPTLDGDRLLALAIPASEKEEDVEERLLLFAADGSGDGSVIPVEAPYSTVSFSEDRRQAVLHFGGGTGSGILQNANQVAIVDLQTQTVRSLTLAGFGGQLRDVAFPSSQGPDATGPVAIGGALRDVVAFLADGEVVLVDAADPNVDQVAVRFLPDVNLNPTQVLLRRGNERFASPVIFLRDDTSPDVAMLTLVDKPDPETGAPGFSAQVSLVPVGTAASDFITHDGDEIPYLVTLNGTQLVFTDIRTQQGFAVALQGNADDLFVRTAETAGGPVRQLVAWASGGNVIHTLDLDGIDDALGRRPERLTIQSGIESLVQLDNDRVLVGSGSTLYVVDFPSEQVTPLSARTAYDPASSAIMGDTLMLGTTGQTWISTVDLLSLNPESMLLDDAIGSFHFLAATAKVVAVHGDRAGYVTVADAANPTRSSSYSAWGVLVEGALDREDAR